MKKLIVFSILLVSLLSSYVTATEVTNETGGTVDDSSEIIPNDDSRVKTDILDEAKEKAKEIRESREKNHEIGDPCNLNPTLPVCF